MPTSNRAKRVLKWIAGIAAVVLINSLLCFVLVPYGSKSEIMWHDYRQAKDLDTVILGTSLVERSVNPYTLDEALGSNSFNMATPSQSLEDTYLGIEQAIKDHDLKRVVMGVEFADLNRKSEKKTGVFVREKTKGESLPEALHDWTTSIDADTWLWSPQAFSMLFFPWQIQHVSAKDLVANVKMRFDGSTIYEAAEMNEPGWKYVGKGFGGIEGVYKYAAKPSSYYVNYGELEGVTEFDPERMAVLERICSLCAENGVQLVMYGIPYADFNIVSFGDNYQVLSDQLAAFAQEHGARYYDFNLARPELFDSKDSYYEDAQHMNIDGANALSASLAKLLAMLDAGEDVSGLFETYAERCARVEGVASACLMPIVSIGDALVMHAESVVGPTSEAEYRFSIAPADSKDYQVVQDWSPTPDCTYAPGKKGNYKIRLEVRAKGQEKPKVTTTQTFAF